MVLRTLSWPRVRAARVLLAALLGTAGLSAVSATPAAAANCPPGSGALVGLHDQQGAVDCFFSVGSTVPDILPPYTSMTIHVRNRVWLHQNANGSGWADCFETQTPARTFTLSGRDRQAGNIQISSNTSRCP